MNGWSELGSLFGGGIDRAGAFDRGRMQGADVTTKLARARQESNKSAAQERMRSDMIANGMDENEASLLTSLFQAGNNPEQLSGYQKDRQDIGFRDQAMGLATGPGDNMNELNQIMTVLGGKPVQVQRSLGQGVMTPNAYNTGSQPVMTEIGQAMAGKYGAQAGAANAQANAANALAAQRSRPGAVSPGKAGAFTMPKADLLDQFFSTNDPQMGQVPDIAKQREFMAWQSQMAEQDPRYRDGNFALAKYMAEQQVVPEAVDLSAPDPGAVQDGYRFIGGDPGKRESWEPL